METDRVEAEDRGAICSSLCMDEKQYLSIPSRITLSWRMFALADVAAISIALLTVGLDSIKAVVVSPVNSQQ